MRQAVLDNNVWEKSLKLQNYHFLLFNFLPRPFNVFLVDLIAVYHRVSPLFIAYYFKITEMAIFSILSHFCLFWRSSHTNTIVNVSRKRAETMECLHQIYQKNSSGKHKELNNKFLHVLRFLKDFSQKKTIHVRIYFYQDFHNPEFRVLWCYTWRYMLSHSNTSVFWSPLI